MKTTCCSFVAGLAVLFAGCNTPKSAHERRLKQAEYEHGERLQQIHFAAEEAKAAKDAGVQIAPPTPSATGQVRPTATPALQSGQPLWVDGVGVSRLRPSRSFGAGAATGFQSPQSVWVDGAGVSRLRPNRSFGTGGVEIRRPQPVWVDRAGVSRLAPTRPNR